MSQMTCELVLPGLSPGLLVGGWLRLEGTGTRRCFERGFKHLLVGYKKAPNVSPVISRTTAPRMVPGRAHGIAMQLLRQFLPGLLGVQGPRVMPSATKVSGEDAVGNRGQIPRGMFGESLVDPGEIPHDL